ncbi:MAG: hypothetical protein GY855_02505, partial [candidate division Zixibacteria bacterium]|nr:hypothetical protein [candidate division Zixibacteria bacterium]
MSWKNASAGATVISGSVTNYAALPTPASSYSGQLWFVENPSQGLLSVLGIYKYPKGIYSPNSSNVWELMPLNVKVSEDAVTLVNITNWSEYIGYAFDIGAGDRLSYNSQTYRNLTGTQTSTAPDTDTTNWIVSGVQGENIAEFVYLKGNLSTDGSIRFSTFADSGDGIFQIRESGVWQPATMEFGTGSVFLGPRVGLAAFGHHVGTEDTYANHMHLHSHNVFNGELTTLGARIIKATSYVENIPLQGDYSGDVFTTNIEFTNTPPANMAFKNVKMKTGSSTITQPIRIQVWQGTDDTGPKIFDQVYPVSDFPTSSDISLVAKGWIQVNNGVTNFLRFSSDANMSFKTNAAMTMPYMAVNASYVQENDMLSNTPWVSGATFTVGQWAVQDEKIYICNTAGVQTGTFASNIALWDLLSSEGNDYWSRTGTVLSPKTAGDSVFIYEGANPICKLWDGDGNDAGTLSLYTGTTQYVHFSADEDSWITGGNFGIGDDDPLSDLHVRFNYAVPAVTVGLTLEQVGAGDCVTHYYLTGGQRVDTGIDNSTTNDDFVIGSGNFGVKYLSIDTPTNTVSVTNLNGNLVDGVTGTTQSADDNSTKVATTAYVDSAVSEEDLWNRSGTTISPKTAGDDITTTGDLTAANITAGSNLGISQAGITNLVVGNTSGKS